MKTKVIKFQDQHNTLTKGFDSKVYDFIFIQFFWYNSLYIFCFLIVRRGFKSLYIYLVFFVANNIILCFYSTEYNGKADNINVLFIIPYVFITVYFSFTNFSSFHSQFYIYIYFLSSCFCLSLYFSCSKLSLFSSIIYYSLCPYYCTFLFSSFFFFSFSLLDIFSFYSSCSSSFLSSFITYHSLYSNY